MTDAFGDGWTFTNFAILDSNGAVVDGAFNSLCSGESGDATYCLPAPGCYSFEVSRGYFPQVRAHPQHPRHHTVPLTLAMFAIECSAAIRPCSVTCPAQEVGWSMCGTSGGAPYSGQLCTSSSTACAMYCPAHSAGVEMTLRDSYGDGWAGGYFALYSNVTGKQVCSI